VAAIDCTGHGVPGAFMSLIGNTLLNQIVKENKLIDPGLILNALNTGIITALNQKHNSDAAQDGMDASIITINTVTNEIEFAGAMNPLYIVSDGALKILNGALKSIGGRPHKRDQEEFKFPKQKLQLKKGDNLYLFSDGFMDQFGGIEDEKFNVQRFSELLLKVSTIKLSKRLEEVDHTFMEWKGVRKQTDDVLLIGIEL
jgi:serine phosphatase RsbU (regulator of sigma subunit)